MVQFLHPLIPPLYICVNVYYTLDFDLIFGATKLNLKIIEVPVRYKRRSYGTTQISRVRHGLLLVRMVIFAYRKLKLVS